MYIHLDLNPLTICNPQYNVLAYDPLLDSSIQKNSLNPGEM